MMNISIILCTFNRCRRLARALESLALSILPETIEWEVLVVDNNSSDQTEAVVKDFCDRYPGRFRYFFESRQGKSYALNAGVREAQGDILAFTDDDVIVDPMWLQSVTSLLYDGRWAGSGGPVFPEPGFVPPRWLALDGPFNLIGALCAPWDAGNTPCELKEPPHGGNMAFRKEMFDKHGLFRTDLGPFPGSKIGFEDTEFGRRLITRGEHLYYVPTAIVFHEINETRIRKDYFLAWWFDFGRGSVREIGKSLTAWRILKILARTLLTVLQWLLAFDPRRRFYRKCRVWYGAGKLVEGFRQEKIEEAEHKLNRETGRESVT